MKNRILTIGKPADWFIKLVNNGQVVQCNELPDAILVFEQNEKSREIIERYSCRYIPVVVPAGECNHKGTIIMPNNELLAPQFLLNFLQSLQYESQRNPLTGLPGNDAISDQINRRILAQNSNWLCYVDMNNFKVYNDRYGFGMADKLIVNLARILEQCIGDNFVGHIGGDDFVFIIKKDEISVLEKITRMFDESLPYFYPEVDWQRNETTGIDRNGKEQKFGFVHLSIAVLTQCYNSLQELNYAASFIKSIAKEQSKNKNQSLWVWDRDVNIWHRDNLLKILQGTDKVAKRTAIEVLGEIADETNFDLFVKLLKDSDPLIRKSAAYALGRIVKQESVTPLLQALNDSSAHVRMRAAEALGFFYDERIPDALLKSMEDENIYVRQAAIKSIGQLKIKKALPRLLGISDRRLNLVVLRALGEIGEPGGLRFIERLIVKSRTTVQIANETRYAIEALAKIVCEDSLKTLLELVEFIAESERWHLYKAIRVYSQLAVMKSLIEAKVDLINKGLGSANPYYPILILYDIGDQRQGERIKKFVKDQRVYIRQASVLYLSNDQRNLDIISDVLLKDRSSYVRQTAAEVLVKFGKAGLPFLRKALKDPAHQVRKSAAQAIMQILF